MGGVGDRELDIAGGPCGNLLPRSRLLRHRQHPLIEEAKALLLGILKLSPGTAGKILGDAMLSPAASPSLHEHVRQSVREAPALADAMRCVSLARPDLTSELARVTCPTLIVAGADDKMYPPSEAATQAARLPNGRCETLTGTSHLGPLEQPQKVAALLQAHLTA